jgi:y4mF family transcriptional regulator
MLVNNAADLAEAVRASRRSAGITQQELADLAGVSVRTISLLEAGESAISFSRLLAVLAVLGLGLSVAASSTLLRSNAPGSQSTCSRRSLQWTHQKVLNKVADPHPAP